MTVAVAADDFGLCAEIDDAICLLHDRGAVTRTSLIVNTARFESSVEALRRRPALEVAVHLNLTDGPPVLPAADVPTLVDAGGSFRGGRHYGVLAGILSGRVSTDDVHREWRAQIAKARSAGLALHELNAHGHLHLLPRLHDVVVRLRRDFDIPRVRLVRSLEWPRGVLLHACSRLLGRRLQQDGVAAVWPDRTVGLRRPGSVDRRINLRTLAKCPGTLVEVIVHPSRGSNAYHERWGYAGTEVTEWLLRHDD